MVSTWYNNIGGGISEKVGKNKITTNERTRNINVKINRMQ